jgi:hypothetical protein
MRNRKEMALGAGEGKGLTSRRILFRSVQLTLAASLFVQ